jgi:hypothetical protein
MTKRNSENAHKANELAMQARLLPIKAPLTCSQWPLQPDYPGVI